MLELVLEPLEAVAALLDQRDLVAETQERARDVRADLAAARHDDVHQTVAARAPGSSQVRTISAILSIAVFVGQTVRMPRAA